MRAQVESFVHKPGVSCGPTALRDVLASRGLDLTEAMVFGLGAGLGFYHLPSSSERGLSRQFVGRRFSLESDCCERLGLSWREHREQDAARAWSQVRQCVLDGRVAVIVTDLRFLPYYQTEKSFNGHLVTLAGFDDESNLVQLGDTDRPGLMNVSLEELARARSSDAAPIGHHDHAWYEVVGAIVHTVNDLPGLLAGAIRFNGEQLLEEPSGLGGLTGLKTFVEDLPSWPSLPDFERVAREGYAAVEKRGTGGGLFRALYAQFLDEAHNLRPELGLKAIAHGYRELAWEWGELATALKLAAKDHAWDGLPQHAQALLDKERSLAERLTRVDR